MNWPSSRVRETFIQYFLRNPRLPHVFIPSSSIVPQNDPSLAFVNAGMNQFKGTILGYGRPRHPRVTNSQKCLRINDLSVVGTDSYHHTFFEMLGNWSFSNYFKKEACEMAWDLLINVYGLHPERLYITYFSGGESISADRETKEIWEDIGVPSSRILPFGKDNFWSMANIGPCGPSTEIHYDHRGTYNDPSKVNQDFASVVEIWNLVFMQYNRTPKGTLERLPLSHVVDTGAGLERLTAVLNGKISNYDTDLFAPIFQTIHQTVGVPIYTGSFQPDAQLDLAYRILADHMRAIGVALADGILPQTNHKIRRLIHRSLSIIETHFLPKVDSEADIVDFLTDILETVSMTISHSYPEVEKMKEETIEILESEVHRFITSRRNRTTYHPSLPKLLTVDFPALARIKQSDLDTVKANGVVDGPTAFKWYDSNGVTDEAVAELCKTLNIRFDLDGLQMEMDKVKRVFREDVAKQLLSSEESLFVRKIESLLSLYNPHTSGGVFETNFDLKAGPVVQVEWVFDCDGDLVEELSADEGSSYWLLLNRTPFFPGSASIVADIGTIELENNCHVPIVDVKQLPSGWILHLITDVPEIGVRRKAEILGYTLDQSRRVGRSLSFNAMYYVKEWLKANFGVLRFNEEFVSWDHIRLELTLLNGELNHSYVRKCEEHVRKHNIPIILNKKTWKQNGVYDLVFATGDSANDSISVGKELSEIIMDLKQLLTTAEQNYAVIRNSIRERVDHLYDYIHHEETSIPYEISLKAEKIINEAERLLEKNELLFETARIANELREITEMGQPFIVERFNSDVEFPSLIKLTRAAGKTPAIVIVDSPDGYIQARCSVPEGIVTEEFRADKWMKSFVSELGRGIYQAPRGQDPKTVVNLKRVRVPNLAERITQGIQAARDFAASKVNSEGLEVLNETNSNTQSQKTSD